MIDFYKDNAVLYDKSHKDYGNKAVTKKVFAPLLAKMPDKTIMDIKKRWHTLRSSLLGHMKKPEEEVKWLYWKDMAFLRRYIESASSENRDAEWSSEGTGVGANFFLLFFVFSLTCYRVFFFFSLSGILLITLLCYVLYVNFVIVCYLGLFFTTVRVY